MASLAEIMASSELANTDIQKGPNLAENFQKGAQLALQFEQLQMAQEEHAAKQKELAQAKLQKFYDYLAKAKEYKGSGPRGNFLKTAIGYRNALGLDPNAIPDDAIKALGYDENLARLSTLDAQIRAGELSPSEAIRALTIPEVFAQIKPTVEDAAFDADIPDAIQNLLNRQSKEGMNAERASAGQGRGQEIQGRFEQSQKTKLADKITALGLPSMKDTLKELNGYVANGIDGWKKGQPIPGISNGQAVLPTNRLDGTGIQVRQAAMSLGNQILKLRSGAAVSDGEAMRTLAELGMVPTIGENGKWTDIVWKGTTNEQAFISGIKRARNHIAKTETVFRNAYGKDVYDSVAGEIFMPPAESSGGKSAPKGDTLFSLRGRQFTREALLKIKEQAQDPNLKSEIDRVLGAKR